MGPEDHNSTDCFGKTHIPLRRGTAARSEGEASQGDVDRVNPELAEEPHQHPPAACSEGEAAQGDVLGTESLTRTDGLD